MIKLYAVPATCALAPHIILEETKTPHEVKILKRGSDPEGWAELKALNALGQVPTIVTDEGYPLTEVTAILQYLNNKSGDKLFPTTGKERFKAFEWLNFIASELHKGFGPLFGPGNFTTDEAGINAIKAKARENMARKLEIAESRFEGTENPIGNGFTIVDAYLYVVLTWAKFVKIDLAPYPKLNSFVIKTAERPSVVAASLAEGLRK